MRIGAFDSWALTTDGHATAAPPKKPRNSRRRMSAPPGELPGNLAAWREIAKLQSFLAGRLSDLSRTYPSAARINIAGLSAAPVCKSRKQLGPPHLEERRAVPSGGQDRTGFRMGRR